jgi:hypothetical protein
MKIKWTGELKEVPGLGILVPGMTYKIEEGIAQSFINQELAVPATEKKTSNKTEVK